MPAAASGRFFLSMSLQISSVFVRILFVALASLHYVSLWVPHFSRAVCARSGEFGVVQLLIALSLDCNVLSS
jgi:hypothetical protein